MAGLVGASGNSTRGADLVRARIAVSLAFILLGLGFALWAVHIPIVSARLRLEPAILGLALLNIGFGAVVSQPLTGWLIGRVGSRRPATVFMLAFLVLFPAPVLAWSTPALFAATLLFGVLCGAFNVAINTQALEIERARGRSTMSSFHGCFSLGALFGASLGGGLIALGWGDGSGVALSAAAMVAIGVPIAFFFPPSQPKDAQVATGKSRRFAAISPALLGVAGL